MNTEICVAVSTMSQNVNSAVVTRTFLLSGEGTTRNQARHIRVQAEVTKSLSTKRWSRKQTVMHKLIKNTRKLLEWSHVG